MREIPMSRGLTRPIRTREKNEPTKGMTRFPLSSRDTLGCFRSKRIVEMQVMKYTNARRNTAELIRSVRPPSKLATYAVRQRTINPRYGVLNLACDRLKASGKSPSIDIA